VNQTLQVDYTNVLANISTDPTESRLIRAICTPRCFKLTADELNSVS